MPLSHRRLATWYVQLAQQLEAGLSLGDALRSAAGSGAIHATAERMAQVIERGGSADDALRAAESALPQGDQLALSAAADAGRMPQTLQRLAARHHQLGAAKLKVLLACLYPAAVLHLALLLLPVTRMIDWEKGFHWSPMRYAAGVAATMGPLWAIILLLVILARRHNPILRWFAGLMPALRGYLRAQALADLAFALANFLEAGVPIGEAWAAAGLITRSHELQRASDAMAATVEQGHPPGSRLPTWPCFPPDFVAQYRTGESTGQLDQSLFRLAGQQQEAANRALAVATIAYPALMFLVVAAGVAYFIITLYAGYLNMLTKLAS